MTYIPKLALELQSFSSIEEMNHHMNLHYVAWKGQLTKSSDSIFHLIKKFSCKVAGVCWLKQENLSEYARVSIKTVERAIHFLKEKGILKIYHTKRSNGLNGNCYYVLQPFQGELVTDVEEIISVEEGNVGAVGGAGTVDTTGVVGGQNKDKLFLSSNQALENSFKASEEEKINNSARVGLKENRVKADVREDLVQFLITNHFSKEAARDITNRVLQSCTNMNPYTILKSYPCALAKFRKRLAYSQPIISVVDYYVRLVLEEIQPSYHGERNEGNLPMVDLVERNARKEKAIKHLMEFKEWLEEKSSKSFGRG
ncbi:hypothetical protein [Neobacillus sp. D3-1R]|uniref:hypothetical protein n=1 Tax=Neobacillus sp. D3-1R TaxID=3445778 RepID=UPI003FA028C5